MSDFKLSSIILNYNINTTMWRYDMTTENEEIKWHELLTLVFDSDLKRTIGLTATGYWISQWPNGAIEVIKSREKCFNILVCLQKERNDFETLLKDALATQHLNLELINTFPFVELIKFAFISKTSWSTNAAYWLREEEMDGELVEIATQFIKNKHFSQGVRHHVFRILKRWQRNQ